MKLPAFVIEHAQTAQDAAGLVHGPSRAGEPLSPAGRGQAIRLGARLRDMARRGIGPGRLISSPARRARETALIAAALAGLPVEIAPELRSLDTGRLAGGAQRDVARRLQPYFANPTRRLPGGESVEAWRSRHLGFMRRVAAEALDRGERPPAFVTHSNVVGSVRAAARKGDPASGADPARRAMAHPPTPARPIRILLLADAGPRVSGTDGRPN